MIRHVVMFKFKAETTQTDRDAFVASLHQLAEDVEQVLALSVGHNFAESPRACDIVLTVDLANPDALQGYADHPDHQPVKQRAGEICSASYVVDHIVG